MPNPEVISSFNVQCEGVVPDVVAPLKQQPAQPIVTVYKDGVRQVSCPYLQSSDGTCRSAELFPEVGAKRAKCVQLFPITSRDRFILPRPRDVSFSPNEEPIDFGSYGAAVRHYSDRVSMTQLDLARFSEMDRTHLNKIIKGTRKPPKAEIVLRQIEVLQLNRDEAKRLAQLAGYDLEKILPEQP